MILDCKGIVEALEAVEAKVLQAQADGAALKATPEKAEAFLPKLEEIKEAMSNYLDAAKLKKSKFVAYLTSVTEQ